MNTKQKPSVKTSTQEFIEIDEIKDDILLLKDRSCVSIIEVGAVNFYLLSSEEQDSIIYSYANLLNSLSFPIQILMLSKKTNISSYLEYIDGRVQKQRSEILKKRLLGYKEFIKNIVKKTSVLEKRFFFVIPFSPLELGAVGANAAGLNKEYIISRAKTSLYPKRDHLLRLLAKVGLSTTVLYKQQIIELFFNLYNPTATGRQLAPIDSYTDTILTA